MTNDTVKLHAYLAQLGIASRRKAEQMIAEGRVVVNDKKAEIGQRVIPTAKIQVDGKYVSGTELKRYFIVNKPQGYVSTTADELNRKTVTNLIPTIKERVYPVGRLDQDSEGLMLLTNDGELAYRLTHPKYEVEKIYKVLVNTEPTEKAIEFLRRGVKFKEGMTKPAKVTLLNTVDEGTWLEITIHEGRKHQVRRMLERAGYQTLRLIRLKMGPLLIKELHGKRYQELTPAQVHKLYTSVGLDTKDSN